MTLFGAGIMGVFRVFGTTGRDIVVSENGCLKVTCFHPHGVC